MSLIKAEAEIPEKYNVFKFIRIEEARCDMKTAQETVVKIKIEDIAGVKD